jgi:transposase InsO family protein
MDDRDGLLGKLASQHRYAVHLTTHANAVAESFFATLKIELVYQTQWNTRAQARSAIFEYIELFYNRRRRHSAIDYLCPDQFELRHHESMAA